MNYIKDASEGQNIHVDLINLKKGLFYTVAIERILFNTDSQKNIALALPSPPMGEKNQLAPPHPGGDVHQQVPPASAAGNHPSNPPTLAKDQGSGNLLFAIHHVDISPEPSSLFKLNPQVNISGHVNLGTIRGSINAKRRSNDLSLNGENIQIHGLPVLERVGIYGDGILKFNYQRRKQRGEITFSIDDAKLKGALTGMGFLPLDVFKEVKGFCTIKDTVNVESLALEGKGIYVRIKGNIAESAFSGNIEIMMDSSFDMYAMVQAFLERYKISTGYYVIPITQKI